MAEQDADYLVRLGADFGPLLADLERMSRLMRSGLNVNIASPFEAANAELRTLNQQINTARVNLTEVRQAAEGSTQLIVNQQRQIRFFEKELAQFQKFEFVTPDQLRNLTRFQDLYRQILTSGAGFEFKNDVFAQIQTGAQRLKLELQAVQAQIKQINALEQRVQTLDRSRLTVDPSVTTGIRALRDQIQEMGAISKSTFDSTIRGIDGTVAGYERIEKQVKNNIEALSIEERRVKASITAREQLAAIDARLRRLPQTDDVQALRGLGRDLGQGSNIPTTELAAFNAESKDLLRTMTEQAKAQLELTRVNRAGVAAYRESAASIAAASAAQEKAANKAIADQEKASKTNQAVLRENLASIRAAEQAYQRAATAREKLDAKAITNATDLFKAQERLKKLQQTPEVQALSARGSDIIQRLDTGGQVKATELAAFNREYQKLLATTQALPGALKPAESALASYFTRVGRYAASIAGLAAIFGTLRAAMASIQFVVDVDREMTRMATTMATAAEEATLLPPLFKAMHTAMREVGLGASEAGKLIFDLQKAIGNNVDQIEGALVPALSLIVTSEANQEEAIRALVGIYNVYGDTLSSAGTAAEKYAKIADVLTVVSRNTVASSAGLAEAIQFSGARARLAGVELEELTVFLGLLQNSLQQAGRSGTGLARTFEALVSNLGAVQRIFELGGGPGASALDVMFELLKKLNVEVKTFGSLTPETLQKVEEAFKLEQAGRTIEVLALQIEKFPELMAKVRTETGASADVVDKYSKSISTAASIMVNEFLIAFDKVVSALAGDEYTGRFATLIRWIDNVAAAFKTAGDVMVEVEKTRQALASDDPYAAVAKIRADKLKAGSPRLEDEPRRKQEKAALMMEEVAVAKQGSAALSLLETERRIAKAKDLTAKAQAEVNREYRAQNPMIDDHERLAFAVEEVANEEQKLAKVLRQLDTNWRELGETEKDAAKTVETQERKVKDARLSADRLRKSIRDDASRDSKKAIDDNEKEVAAAIRRAEEIIREEEQIAEATEKTITKLTKEKELLEAGGFDRIRETPPSNDVAIAKAEAAAKLVARLLTIPEKANEDVRDYLTGLAYGIEQMELNQAYQKIYDGLTKPFEDAAEADLKTINKLIADSNAALAQMRRITRVGRAGEPDTEESALTPEQEEKIRRGPRQLVGSMVGLPKAQQELKAIIATIGLFGDEAERATFAASRNFSSWSDMVEQAALQGDKALELLTEEFTALQNTNLAKTFNQAVKDIATFKRATADAFAGIGGDPVLIEAGRIALDRTGKTLDTLAKSANDAERALVNVFIGLAEATITKNVIDDAAKQVDDLEKQLKAAEAALGLSGAAAASASAQFLAFGGSLNTADERALGLINRIAQLQQDMKALADRSGLQAIGVSPETSKQMAEALVAQESYTAEIEKGISALGRWNRLSETAYQQQISLAKELARANGDVFGFLNASFEQAATAGHTFYDDLETLAKNTASSISSSFSDILFAGFQGQLEDAKAAFKSFMLSLLREITNFISTQAVRSFLGLFKTGSTGSSAIANIFQPARSAAPLGFYDVAQQMTVHPGSSTGSGNLGVGTFSQLLSPTLWKGVFAVAGEAFGAGGTGFWGSISASFDAVSAGVDKFVSSLGISTSALTTLAAAAGIVVGSYNLFTDVYAGKNTPARGASSGAAIGAGVGTLIAPGIGTLIGLLAGAAGGALKGSTLIPGLGGGGGRAVGNLIAGPLNEDALKKWFDIPPIISGILTGGISTLGRLFEAILGEASQYGPKRAGAAEQANLALRTLSPAFRDAARSNSPAQVLSALQRREGPNGAVRSDLSLTPEMAARLGIDGDAIGDRIVAQWVNITQTQFSKLLSEFQKNPDMISPSIVGSGDVPYLEQGDAQAVADQVQRAAAALLASFTAFTDIRERVQELSDDVEEAARDFLPANVADRFVQNMLGPIREKMVDVLTSGLPVEEMTTQLKALELTLQSYVALVALQAQAAADYAVYAKDFTETSRLVAANIEKQRKLNTTNVVKAAGDLGISKELVTRIDAGETGQGITDAIQRAIAGLDLSPDLMLERIQAIQKALADRYEYERGLIQQAETDIAELYSAHGQGVLTMGQAIAQLEVDLVGTSGHLDGMTDRLKNLALNSISASEAVHAAGALLKLTLGTLPSRIAGRGGISSPDASGGGGLGVEEIFPAVLEGLDPFIRAMNKQIADAISVGDFERAASLMDELGAGILAATDAAVAGVRQWESLQIASINRVADEQIAAVNRTLDAILQGIAAQRKVIQGQLDQISDARFVLTQQRWGIEDVIHDLEQSIRPLQETLKGIRAQQEALRLSLEPIEDAIYNLKEEMRPIEDAIEGITRQATLLQRAADDQLWNIRLQTRGLELQRKTIEDSIKLIQKQSDDLNKIADDQLWSIRLQTKGLELQRKTIEDNIDLIEEWSNAVAELEDYILGLALSDQAPPDAIGQFQIAQSGFDKLLADFMKNPEAKDLGPLQEAASQLITALGGIYEQPSSEYADIFRMIQGQLEGAAEVARGEGADPAQLEDLVAQLENIDGQMEGLNEEAEAINWELEQQTRDLDTQRENLESDLGDLDTQLGDLNTEAEDINFELDEQTRILDKQRVALEDQLLDMGDVLKELELQKEQVLRQITLLDRTAVAVEAQIGRINELIGVQRDALLAIGRQETILGRQETVLNNTLTHLSITETAAREAAETERKRIEALRDEDIKKTKAAAEEHIRLIHAAMLPVMRGQQSATENLHTFMLASPFQVLLQLAGGTGAAAWLRTAQENMAAWTGALLNAINAFLGGDMVTIKNALVNPPQDDDTMLINTLTNVNITMGNLDSSIKVLNETLNAPYTPPNEGTTPGDGALATGAWSVVHGNYELHDKEMVVPSGPAELLRQSASGWHELGQGGGDMSVQIGQLSIVSQSSNPKAVADEVVVAMENGIRSNGRIREAIRRVR